MNYYDYNIAILIPCYNEENSIRQVIEDFRNEIPTGIIYVYDNNSTDNTAKISLESGAHVIKSPNQGKGNTVKQMFDEIEAEIYIMVDGDYTYFAKNASQLVSGVVNGYDMMIGDRLSSTYFTENKRPFHNIGNRIVRFLVNNLFKGNVNDVMTGYRAFSRQFVKSINIETTGFEIETEMTIYALENDYNIGQTVIDYKDRVDSKSKLNTVRDGIKIIRYIFKKKYQKKR